MKKYLNSWTRVLPVLFLLAGTALLLHARNREEVLPSYRNLATFPMQVGTWIGSDIPLSDDVLQVLGPGQFLNRTYQQTVGGSYVSFFIAYFPSQRAGDIIHSPKNCIPGAGWTPIESTRTSIASPTDAETIQVNRYVIGKVLDRKLVLYWYQAHGRVLASEYWAKVFLVTDSVRMNRSDGALVRIITPIGESEPTTSAQTRAVQFADLVLSKLDAYIPR